MLRWAAMLLPVAGLLSGCSSDRPALPLVAPAFFADNNPQDLRDWGMVQVDRGVLRVSPGVTPYDLNSALFTDYAQKLRTIWMPPGVSATYSDEDSFDFPVGTVITKTFFYQTGDGGDARVRQIADTKALYSAEGDIRLDHARLIETRLLIRRAPGWVALTYVWDADQTKATLKRTGAVVPLELIRADGEIEPFSYVVPNATQCAGCHATDMATKAILPIGPKARHLNRDYPYYAGEPRNQLARLTAASFLTGAPAPAQAPRLAGWTDTAQSVEARARAYLDINCAHCHSLKGPADTSGLYLEHDRPLSNAVGRCKLPVAAGGGTGDRRFDIVPGKPGESIITYRMSSTNPAERMPEIGRSTAHREAVDLMAQWIAGMDGSCQ